MQSDRLKQDDSLAVPALAAPTAAFSLDDAVLRAVLPGDAICHAAGFDSDASEVHASATRGVHTMRIGRFHLQDVRLHASAAHVAIGVTSLGLQLRRANDHDTDSIVLLPDTGALLMQPASGGGLTLRFAIRIDEPLLFHATASGLRLRRGDHDIYVLIRSGQASGLPRLLTYDGNSATFEVTLAADDAPRVLQMQQLPANLPAHAAVAELNINVPARVRSLHASQNRLARDAFAVDLEDAPSQDVEWAKQRLALAPRASARDVAALLAIGAATHAWTAADALLHDATQDPDRAAGALFAFARCFTATADVSRMRALWPRAAALVAAYLQPSARDAQTRGSTDTTNQAALQWIHAATASAAVARDAGDGQLADALEARARKDRVEHAAAVYDARWTDAFTAHQARVPGAASALHDTHPADTLLRYYSEILGIEPDAPRGRLTMSPALPPSWTRGHVRNVRVGEAGVSMRFERSAASETFVITQDAGPVPLTLVFVPSVDDGLPVRVIVDGVPATLDPRPVRGRIAFPVQVALDGERTIVFERVADVA